jgi:hypothetical protein
MLEAFAEAPPPPAAKEPSLPKEVATPKPASNPNISSETSTGKNANLPPLDQAKRSTISRPSDRQCPKCGSAKLVLNAMVQGAGQNTNVRVAVDANPDALIFKERQYAVLLADICGDCGHVELQAQDYRSLYNHYLQSKNS